MSLNTKNVPDLCDRFEAAVRRHGDRPAIEFDTRIWTYEEIDRLSDDLAHRIGHRIAQPGCIVAIDCERHAILVLSILACVKAGAVFFVLGENQPEHYVARALENVGNILWLGSEGHADEEKAKRIAGDRLSAYLALEKMQMEKPCVSVEESSEGMDAVPRRHGVEDPVLYMVATSGTTGRPKLVSTSVSPILNFIDWYQETFSLSYEDKFSMLSGLGYDPLIRDILTPLCIGACVSIPANEVLGKRGGLHGWIDAARVSVIHATPQLAQLVFPQDETQSLESVRVIAIGGSTLGKGLARHIRSLLPSGVLVNVYGATETPQVMSYHVVENLADDTSSPEHVPIGRPIRNVDIQVFDDQGAPVEHGEVGEIHVLTQYLAVGYHQAPELTREKFIYHEKSSRRAYRTGDLGFIDRRGDLHYVGRKDRQVKHRGYRIQLEEIEQAIHGAGQIAAAAVVYEDFKESAVGAGKIICYLQAESGAHFKKADFKQKLMDVLPAYMMPDSYVVVEKMPLNSRHKIDYAALKSAVDVSDPLVMPQSGPSMQNNVVARELLSMWAEVLGTSPTNISPDKKFFDIGGNSLLSVALIKDINRAFSKKLKVTDLYLYSNINELSKYISHESENLGQPDRVSNVSRRAENLSKMRTARNRRDGIKL